MAQNKNTGLNIEELKKSLKTLSAEMNPDQLRRANETLEKLESVTAKGNKENVEIQETNIKIEKSLGKNGDLNKSLLQLQKLYKESQKENLKLSKQQLAKLDKLGQPDIKKVGPIREDNPLTVREGLKEMVAGGKSTVSSVVGGVKAIGSGIRDVFTKPGDVFNKVKGKVAAAYETGKEFLKDVATTEKDYDVRGERFGDRTALSKADQRKEQGSLLDPKLAARLDKNVAKVSYKKMLGAEEGLIEANKKISEFERSGLPVPKELMKQKESLEKTHRESDVRNTFAPVATKAATKVKAPEGAAEKANEATEKSAVETLTKARAENPEADNIVSANEKMADSLNDLSLTSKDLLSATKESVDILKGIRADLASDDIQALKSEPFERVASNADVAANDSNGGLNASDVVGAAGDLIGNRGSKTPGKGFPRGGAKIPGPVSKPSLGGRILGGLKSAGPGLLKGGAIGIGGLALGYGADKLKESGHEKLGGAADVGAEALSGAGMGAMLGSIVPGVGTAIGGAVGGVIGAGYGLYKNKDALFGGDKKKDEGGGQSTKYGREAEKLADEALKNGVDPLNLEATILEKLQEKYKDEKNIEYLETAAFSAAMKANNKKDTIPKSNKIKAGGKEYSSFDELDRALINKEITPTQRQNAIKFFQKENPEAYQKEFEKREKREVTAKMEDGQVGAMQPAAAQSPDMQLDQDIKANQKRVAEVTPSRPSSKSGELSNSSLEYNDLTREAAQPKPTPAPVIMNNSSNNSTTKIMPMKADPRPSDRGSAFERHIERTSAY